MLLGAMSHAGGLVLHDPVYGNLEMSFQCSLALLEPPKATAFSSFLRTSPCLGGAFEERTVPFEPVTGVQLKQGPNTMCCPSFTHSATCRGDVTHYVHDTPTAVWAGVPQGCVVSVQEDSTAHLPVLPAVRQWEVLLLATAGQRIRNILIRRKEWAGQIQRAGRVWSSRRAQALLLGMETAATTGALLGSICRTRERALAHRCSEHTPVHGKGRRTADTLTPRHSYTDSHRAGE